MAISMLATWLKRLGAVCLAFVIFWHVSQHAAPRRGQAIVHVSQPQVLVLIDHQEYFVPTFADSPVVCDLEPGEHRVQVWKHGVLLGEEDVQIEAGKEVVVSPFDGSAVAKAALIDERAPGTKEAGQADLAARVRRIRPTSAVAN